MDKKYRKLKAGEVVKETDEYISTFTPGVYSKVNECTVGKKLLECNIPYYRRPLGELK